MPGPPPHHPSLTVLRGNPGKHKRRSAVEPSVMLQPPEPLPFLNGRGRAEWHRVAPELHRLGLLTALDTAALGAYCQAYAMWRDAVELLGQTDDEELKGKLSRAARMAADQMLRCGEHFGLTPHARLRLSGTTPPQGPGKFEGLIGPDAS